MKALWYELTVWLLMEAILVMDSVKSGKEEVPSPVFCVSRPEKIPHPITIRKSQISTFLELLDIFLQLPFFTTDTVTFQFFYNSSLSAKSRQDSARTRQEKLDLILINWVASCDSLFCPDNWTGYDVAFKISIRSQLFWLVLQGIPGILADVSTNRALI